MLQEASSVDPKYPIGQYEPVAYAEATKQNWLRDIKFLPNDVEMAIQNLDEVQLKTPYRDGGWTVHQLVHHLADSHMNAYIRFKLGLTEDSPAITTYDENAWATLNDVALEPINVSITLLHALHRRWVSSLLELTEQDWQRTIYHPAHQKQVSLWTLLGMYAWHGRHHVAHITALKERKGWN
jgi:uncharacterized damage-inducible protein DinB